MADFVHTRVHRIGICGYMDMDMDVIFHIHGNPGCFAVSNLPYPNYTDYNYTQLDGVCAERFYDQRCADITFWYPYPIRIRYQVSVSVSVSA